MPNWCMTSATISGPPEEMKILWDKFEEIEDAHKGETDFGGSWLGHILDHLGEYDHKTNTASCNCRGSITYREKVRDEITIDMETAWGPMMGPIVKLCDKYAPTAEIVYTATEPGMCVYLTNDPSVAGCYLLDIWDSEGLPDSIEGDYEILDDDDLRERLDDACEGCAQHSIKDLIDIAIEKFGNNLSINQFQYADLQEVC